MKVLLDTNILTRWVNAAAAGHQEATASLRKLREAGHVPVLVPQNFYEFWVVATRPQEANGLGMTVEAATGELDRFALPLFSVLVDDSTLLKRWQALVVDYDVKGKPAHDARLVAAMQCHGVTHLLSFNTVDFNRYRDITPVSPAEVIAGNLL